MTSQLEMFVLEGTLPNPKTPNDVVSVHFNFYRDATSEGIRVQYMGTAFGDPPRSFTVFPPIELYKSVQNYSRQKLIVSGLMMFRSGDIHWFKTEDARSLWNHMVTKGWNRHQPT